MSRDYITNPINTLGNYLIPWTGVWTGILGQQTIYNTTTTDQYSYGSWILTQTQPVLYPWTTLITGWIFDTTKFIWSDIRKITGDLLGVSITTEDTWLIVTGIWDSLFVTKYTIMWDTITNYSDININTNTSIYVTNTIGNKNIITQIFNPTSYFAMHFQKNTTLINTIDCKIWWNNSNFITGAFWNGTVTDENIICALYGTWGDDQTAYTENWSGYNDSCNVSTMDVIYTGKLSLTTLSPNTIYVLTWQISTWSSTISIENCSAVISNQNTGTLFQSTTSLANGLFYQNAKQYVIFDNIVINGTWGWWVPAHAINSHGININDYNMIANTTLHNITSYNNNQGIALYGNYILWKDILSYNNEYDGIYLAGENINLNNIDIYNNWWDGGIFVEEWCTYCSFNNIQTHNNWSAWLSLNGFYYSLLNNIQAYNNGVWIVLNWETNVLHNISSYNNSTYWLNNTAINTKYYWPLQTFNNANYYGEILITGNASSDFPWFWRTDGEMITTGTMSRDYITNPINTLSNYLLSWSGTWTTIRGQKTAYKNTSTDKYSYGSGIFTQIQPVLYLWTTLTTWEHFDTTKFIWSNVTKITGDTTIIWTTIFGSSNNPAISLFSVFWDIEIFKIWQSINTTTGVIFTTWISTNTIITQLYSTSYFATHFQKETQPWLPTIYFTGTTPIIWQTITGNNFAPQLEMTNIENVDTFIYTFSGIEYSYYDSWLVLMMNFDNISVVWETNDQINDFSQYGNNGSWYNGILRTGNGRWNGAYRFDGVNDYINIPYNSSIIFGNSDSFSIAWWINIHGLFSWWIYNTVHILGTNVYSTTPWYGIRCTYTYPPWNTCTIWWWTRTWSTVIEVQWGLIQTNERNYIVYVYKANNVMEIYVNWILKWSTSNVSMPNFASPTTLNIGNKGLWWNAQAFSWLIDEIRIRKRALSSGEVLQMRRSNLSKYDIDKRRFVDDRQCMSDGTYTYTGYVKNNIWLSDMTGRISQINIANYTAIAPIGYFIGSTWVSSQQVTLSGQFTDYFKLEDWKWTTGWYTTIQLPLKLSGTNIHTNYIDRNNISFWATGINEIWWWVPTSQVYVTGSLATPQTFSGAINYIIRDFTGWYSCPTGVYGNKPYISVDIPAYQNPDTYSGIITIDLNN